MKLTREFLMIAVPVFTIFVMFENHYLRDTVGALEKQMESDLGLLASQYSMLNTVYFVPNIIAPLFTGTLCEHSGSASKFLVYCALIGAIGNLIFVFGAQISDISLFYLGRFLCGSVYEIIDTVPIIILGPLYKQNWGLVVGMMNGSLRLGTVFTFALSPIVYRYYGVLAALWMSVAVGALGIISAYWANSTDIQLVKLLEVHDQEDQSPLIPREPSDNLIKTVSTGEEKPLLENISATEKGTYATVSNSSANSTGSTAGQREKEAAEDGGYTMRNGGGDVVRAIDNVAEDEVEGGMEASTSETHFRNLLRAESFRAATEKSQKNKGLNTSFSTSSLDKLNQHVMSVGQWLWKELPFRDYGNQFIMYLFNGMFLFGSMVPFWFIGSKFFQINYLMDVQHADFLMLLPEGAMVFISPVLGYVLDSLKLSLTFKLHFLAAACTGMAVAYCLLANGFSRIEHTDHGLNDGIRNNHDSIAPADGNSIVHIHYNPLYPIIMLGSCYACANSLSWDTIVHIIPDTELLAPASGLYASALNVLPAIVPHIIVFVALYDVPAETDTDTKETITSESARGLYVLAFMALLAGLFALFASFCPIHDTRPTATGSSPGDTQSRPEEPYQYQPLSDDDNDPQYHHKNHKNSSGNESKSDSSTAADGAGNISPNYEMV